MRGFASAAVLVVALAGAASAQGWVTPERGSATRAALMDAIRPHAEWMLGAPVEFRVNDLRLLGNRAFAMLEAQRPGGGAIDVLKTPMVARGEFDPYLADTPHIEVLYVKSGDTWVALHWAIGATDVWYAWEPLCAPFRALIPEVCPYN
ncbi:MAG: hypothetical protein CVT82_13475 [Alphaproteobacteria bacterium HGW-Alphaproteobacteria-4]|jgi:hypothetical protein|nr:MAG: hypothetical protein CVT82_13475 [Alphaproteobacteria bacterium HGW-Alphaproteobacteria-4]